MVKFKEPFNGISHLLGSLASVVVTVLLVRAAVTRGGARAGVPFLVYGLSMVLLYSASAIVSPARRQSEDARHAAQARPHQHLRPHRGHLHAHLPGRAGRQAWARTLCWAVWGLAGAVILTDIFWLDAPRGLKAGLYVLLGWFAVWATVPLQRAIGWGGMAWMLAGGLAYSVGALLYAIKKPNPWPGVDRLPRDLAPVRAGRQCGFRQCWSGATSCPW